MKNIFIATLIMLNLMIPASLYSQSLWVNDGSLYSDFRPKIVGDIITIIIEESAQAENKDSTANQKEVGVDASPTTSSKNLLSFIPLIGGKGKTTLKGSGKTERSGMVKAKITASVIEVLPGGNLRIEGKRAIKINNEQQVITVSGLIRPQDVNPDNSIYSKFISDAKIVFDGDLKLTDKEKDGVVTRIFSGIADFLF